jgi:hypothetical protein
MGTYSVRLPIGAVPSQFFRDIPEQARSFLRRGFSVLSHVFPRYSEAVLSIPAETLMSRTQQEPGEIANKLAITNSEATNLLGALSFLALVSTSADEPIGAIVAALLETEFIGAPARQAVESVLTHYQRERAEVTGAFRKAAVSSRVLPSLVDFELSIDVRLDFEKEQISLAVPLIVAHLDTDAVHEELWFQMTKAQAERLSDDLKKVLARIEQAEKWTQSRS